MTKFTDKAMTGFPMAFYYAVMKAMDDRTAAVETALERFLTMETEFHRLFTAFDVAYKNSLKSQLGSTDDRYFCFVCWPCTMPVSRHSCEEPYFRLI